VTDGDNRVLYEEEAVRQVNVADRSSAVNLFYGIDGSINGVPAKNPIKFTVIDLDYLNKPSRNVIEAAYNADCLSASSVTNSPANFLDLAKGTGLIKDFTRLYYAPGADHPTDKKVLPGMKMSAVYRSADSRFQLDQRASQPAGHGMGSGSGHRHQSLRSADPARAD
jgi:hypothetical protein